jgi:predicted ATP-grasp superfamily ATP-dependent carboligase
MLDLKYQNVTSERPPVFLQADLDLLRTLGMAGIPVIVGSSDNGDPTFASRYCRGRCILPSRRRPDALVAAMLDAGNQLFSSFGRRIPLMCAQDDWLELLYAHRDRLQEKFLLLLNDQEVAIGLLTKDRFEALARKRDLHVPRSLPWETLCESQGAVVAKPRSRSFFYDSLLYAQLFGGESKAIIFESGSAAASHALVERFRDQLTFQEYVRGNDCQLWSFHGFSDERGTVLADFVGRKLRTWPPLTGQSAFIEMVHDEELAMHGRRIAEHLPLKGVFKMDFKTDALTGKHFLLEANARFNLWNHLGAVNGVNLMQVAYEYLVAGKRPPPQPYCTETRWICLPHDFRAYRVLAARGELSFFEWISSILFTRTVHKHFAWSDPLPFVIICANRFVHMARRLPERIMVRLRKWLSTAS